jgi:hypothetical protein
VSLLWSCGTLPPLFFPLCVHVFICSIASVGVGANTRTHGLPHNTHALSRNRDPHTHCDRAGCCRVASCRVAPYRVQVEAELAQQRAREQQLVAELDQAAMARAEREKEEAAQRARMALELEEQRKTEAGVRARLAAAEQVRCRTAAAAVMTASGTVTVTVPLLLWCCCRSER